MQVSKLPQPGLTPSFNPGTAAPYPTYPKGWQYQGQDTTAPAIFQCPNTKTYDKVDVSFVKDSIQSDSPTYDRKYWSLLGEKSVLQYYQLIGVLNPASGGNYKVPPGYNGATTYTNSGQMANTTMETYSQPGSCFQCHAFAAPQGAAKDSKGYPAQSGNQISGMTRPIRSRSSRITWAPTRMTNWAPTPVFLSWATPTGRVRSTICRSCRPYSPATARGSCPAPASIGPHTRAAS